MSDSIESKAKTVEEAVSEALLQLGARKDEVEIEVIDEARSGLFGLIGSRQAKVRVTRKASSGRGRGGSRSRRRSSSRKRDGEQGRTPKRQDGGRSSAGAAASGQAKKPDGRRGGRQSGKKTEQKAGRSGRTPDRQAGPRAEQPARRGSSRGGRDRGRKDTGRPDQGQQSPREQSTRQQSTRRQDTRQQNRRSQRSDRHGSREEQYNVKEPSRRPAAAAVEQVDHITVEPTKAAARVEVMREVPENQIVEMLENLTNKLMVGSGFPCRCQIQPGDYHQVQIVTDERSAGILIGRHGSTIDALEHIMERMASQAAGERVKMNLDINNYRRRREETLMSRAEELVARVKETGKETHLETMSARERRIIHLEVAKHNGVRTYTATSYGGKHVVIGIDDGTRDSDGVANNTQSSEPETSDGAVDRDDRNEAAEPSAGTEPLVDATDGPETDERPADTV